MENSKENAKKRVKMLGLITFAATALTISQFSPLANASRKETGEVTTVVEVDDSTQVVSQEVDLGEFEEVTKVVPHVEETSITPFGVDNTDTFSLAVGKSWSDSFKMNNLINEDHNAFNVKVSGVKSGKYKIIITSSDGYEYESKEYTSGVTIETTGAKTNVKYTVTILNTSATTLKGKVNITSYID